MIEKLKDYLIQVALSKYLPMGGLAAIAALGTFMAAHAGILEQYGVTFGTWPLNWPTGQQPSGPCILIELDTLSTAAITAIVGLVTVILRATQHHTTGSTDEPKAPAAPPVGMVIALIVAGTLVFGLRPARADSLAWQTPYGTFQLPFESTEMLMGWDGVNGQAIYGASLPVYQAPHNIAALQAGAVGAFHTQALNVQPYVALGHDIARDIPALDRFRSLHLNGFIDYAADHGNMGAGGSISYSFFGTPTP